MPGLSHQHIVSLLQSEIAVRRLTMPTILDAGCGDGALLALIGGNISAVRSGFDSSDYGLQSDEKVGSLAGADVDIRFTGPDGKWPFPDDQFDVVISNQVCEHVADFALFCSENARVLKPGGFGLHTFPLRHMLIEPHMRLPLVHRVRDHELRTWLIAQMSRLGMGIYKSQGPELGVGVMEFARAHADYARTFTTYRSWSQVSEEFHRQGLRVSYRHTSALGRRALSRALNRRPPSKDWPILLESLSFPFIRMITSCTLVVEKRQEYSYSWRAGATTH
jgi:SAM-dependent methyltransferase